MFEAGAEVYLTKEIIEPACGDHPDFLMGRKGEKVIILEVDENHHYPYSVEGPTNPGKPWRCGCSDVMRTKPMF